LAEFMPNNRRNTT